MESRLVGEGVARENGWCSKRRRMRGLFTAGDESRRG